MEDRFVAESDAFGTSDWTTLAAVNPVMKGTPRAVTASLTLDF